MSDTAKSVLEIDVKDEAFRRFMEMFQKYQQGLEDSNKAWTDIGASTTDAAAGAEKLLTPAEAIAAAAAAALEGHKDIAELLKSQSDLSRQLGEQSTKQLSTITRLLESEGRSETTLKQQATLWTGIVTSTKDVAHWVGSATSDLLRWGTLGLLGAGGGLFGLDKLGQTAGAWRRQAMGLGLGNEIGDVPAFSAFSRFVDPQSFLGGVQSAIQDPTKSVPFSALSMARPAYNANPAAVAAEVIQRLPGYVRSQQALGRPMETMFQTGQFANLGISFQDFVRLGQTAPKEMNELVQKFRQQAAVLDKLVTPDIAKRWQDFTLQLQFAGQTLQATLIRGLVGLTGPLERLSGSVVNFLEKLTGTKNVDDFVALVGHGIDKLTGWVNSISQKDVNDFENAIKTVGDDLLDFGKRLNNILKRAHDFVFGSSAASTPAGPGVTKDPAGHVTGPNGTLWQNPNGAIIDPATGMHFREQDGVYYEIPNTGIQKQSFVTPPATWGGGFSNAAFTQVEAANRLPPGTLRAVEWAESRGDPRAVSPAGAEGLFQFMPGTARDLGINPRDPGQALQGAGEYLGQLFRQFGSLDKALAAYNEGPGALQSQIARWGKDWAQHLPAETEHYVAGIARTMAQSLRNLIPGSAPRNNTVPPITVTVLNNSGANVHVAFGQLGVGTVV